MFWNQFSDKYAESIESHSIPPNFTLYSLTHAYDKEKVLETGVGAGTSSHLFTTGYMKKDGYYAATDISEEMVKKLQSKYEHSPYFKDSEHKFKVLDQKKDESDVEDLFKNDKVKGKKVCIGMADSEYLPFANNQFDVYIASFSLHIVADHMKMLSEAMRVLKPGGVAGFSVWGRRHKSPYFKLLPKIMADHGVKFPPQKTYFHLGDILDQEVKKAGFKNIKFCYQDLYLNEPKEVSLGSMLASPFFQKVWKGIDSKTQESIVGEYNKEFDEKFSSKTQDMISFETAFCIGYK